MNDSQGKSGWRTTLPGGGEKRHHCLVNRRAGLDRRRVYNLTYFTGGGFERRQAGDRRRNSDRRRYWERRGMPCLVSPD